VTTRSFLLQPVSGGDPAPAANPPAAVPDASTPSLADIGAGLIPPQLLAEIERRAHTLLILPANDISTVPFAALPATRPGAHLIDIATPIVLPSIDGLFFWVHGPTIRKTSNVLIVGDPDLSGDTKWRLAPLPGARQEAMTVAKLFGKVALVGKDANATEVGSRLGGRDLSLIYFATHGISDAVNPMDDSFLALSGKHLRAADIKGLKYPEVHPLVVMSACQSGLGKVFTGGVFGLARAWIYAGASQVLASQWNVDDAATAHLMEHFMRRVTQGESVQSAFQKAMVTTRKLHPDVAQWGSFNLFGYPQPTW
jgi:CHAT domain-containing protein